MGSLQIIYDFESIVFLSKLLVQLGLNLAHALLQKFNFYNFIPTTTSPTNHINQTLVEPYLNPKS